jgi:hypothetical protein
MAVIMTPARTHVSVHCRGQPQETARRPGQSAKMTAAVQFILA